MSPVRPRRFVQANGRVARALERIRRIAMLQKFGDRKLRGIVANQAAMAQLDNDVPCYSMETNELLSVNANDAENVWSDETFENWANALNEYLFVLENRLFSEGLHVLGDNRTRNNRNDIWTRTLARR